jgi:hypothetical protein
VTPLPLPRAAGALRSSLGLRLYGVVSLAAPGRLAVDGAAASARERLHTPPLGTPAAEVVRARDLGAVVAAARYAPEPLTDDLVRGYRAVVEAVFADRAVLPAPPGALFRSRAALTSWMELHAASLAEGLRFVEDRAEARVTIEAVPGVAVVADGAPDAVALAAEAFAVLRREAAALLVLRGDDAAVGPIELAAAPPTGGTDERPGALLAPGAPGVPPGAQAAFLVDRGRWDVFAQAVAREARRLPAVRLACAGPWPPYSFVRLDFTG